VDGTAEPAETGLAEVKPGGIVLVRLEANVDAEWHMYSLTTPPGPIPTTIRVGGWSGDRNVTYFEPPALTKFDPNFNANTETYEGKQIFLARVRLKDSVPAGALNLTFEPRYQTCSGTVCIPPRTRQVAVALNVNAGAKTTAAAIPAGYIEAKPRSGAPGATSAERRLDPFPRTGFRGWPCGNFHSLRLPDDSDHMSYFVGHRGGVAQAVTFCIGIIVLFTAFGGNNHPGPWTGGRVALGSNPWVNGFIALVFFTFGLSLLGAFEITIPSGLLTKLNDASGKGGYLGSLLMGLTFALASFACVGPFMGTLLAASVQGGALRPLVGMATFATGLALPFFLLASVPQLPGEASALRRMAVAREGGHGLLRSHRDAEVSLQPRCRPPNRILTRERFLALWVVLLAIAGGYLAGFRTPSRHFARRRTGPCPPADRHPDRRDGLEP